LVLRNGGFQLGGQKRPGRARERRREWLTTIVAITQEKEKEGRRDGRGGTRIGTTRKNREGRVHRSTLAREECEGVTGGVRGSARECEGVKAGILMDMLRCDGEKGMARLKNMRGAFKHICVHVFSYGMGSGCV
jgi:hypothetical protein